MSASQVENDLINTSECVEVLNVDKAKQIKNLVLDSTFKVKQLHKTKTQCYGVGDYLLQSEIVEGKGTIEYYRVEPGMTLVVVGEELRNAMGGIINPEALTWLEHGSLEHKLLPRSLHTTENCFIEELHIKQLHTLFRGNAVPRHLLNCAKHHRYTGIPENLFKDVKVFEKGTEFVAPYRVTKNDGTFIDESWLVFYASSDPRYINVKTSNAKTLTLHGACMAFRFINDRRHGAETFLNIECWLNPI